jgi:hypothetical protein
VIGGAIGRRRPGHDRSRPQRRPPQRRPPKSARRSSPAYDRAFLIAAVIAAAPAIVTLVALDTSRARKSRAESDET